MQEKLLVEGVEYVSDSCFVYGDYGGAGSLGVANVRHLKENFDWMGIGMSQIEPEKLAGEFKYRLRYYGVDEVQAHLETGDPLPDVLLAEGQFGSVQAWLRADAEGADEIMAAMADYPVLDDQELSKVEMEWEQEAWDGWLRSDLMKTLRYDYFDEADEDEDKSLEERADEQLTDAQLFEAYRAAMDECNVYPTPELNGVHIPVERIAGSFGVHVVEALKLDNHLRAREIAREAGQLELNLEEVN
jgi:hypothetical protein